MALEPVIGTHGTRLQEASTRGGLPATAASGSGAASRGKTQARVEGFRPLIEQAARRYYLDTALLAAVVHVESGGNPQAVSPVGAQGLTQLMPATAQHLGVNNPFDPAESLNGAAKYLRGLLGKFGGDVSKALAAYNAGEGNVRKYGGIPPFAETQAYVPAVLAASNAYRQPQPGSDAPSRQDVAQSPTGDIAAGESGGLLPHGPSSLRLAWFDAEPLRSSRPRPEREAQLDKGLPTETPQEV
jgi:hypothetical protein